MNLDINLARTMRQQLPVGRLSQVMRRPFGVNVAGHMSSEKGVGEAVRSAIRILEAAQIPYVLNNFTDPGALNNDITFGGFSKRNPYRFNLVVLGSDAVQYFAREMGQDYFKNHYNIGHWAWELTDFPPEWQSNFQLYNEIWVASTFVENGLKKLAPVPVVTVPYTLSSEIPTNISHHLHFGLPRDAFVFLFIFDFHSYIARKNPLGVVNAFKQAFSPKENVLLILKCSHSEWARAELRRIQEASQDAKIRITDCIMTREQLQLLIYYCNCYVSLHRAEGFGLTMAEAMTMEKPVIATGYSGNMDFMTPDNSFPVKYKLVPIEQDQGPYKKGFIWADPDVDHAAELMRFVYDNREIAAGLGRRARQDVLAKFTPAALGQRIRDRLRMIPQQAGAARSAAGSPVVSSK